MPVYDVRVTLEGNVEAPDEASAWRALAAEVGDPRKFARHPGATHSAVKIWEREQAGVQVNLIVPDPRTSAEESA